VLLALLLCGCSTIVGTRTKDGDLTLTSHRFLWASEGISFSLSDTNGLTTSLKVQKSSSDATSIDAVFNGMERLGVKAAKAAGGVP
jgi:hypothetical protein